MELGAALGVECTARGFRFKGLVGYMVLSRAPGLGCVFCRRFRA